MRDRLRLITRKATYMTATASTHLISVCNVMPSLQGFLGWTPKQQPTIKLKTRYAVHNCLDGVLGTDQLPLIVIHGGPGRLLREIGTRPEIVGIPHDYLLPLVEATPDRPVVFYE